MFPLALSLLVLVFLFSPLPQHESSEEAQSAPEEWYYIMTSPIGDRYFYDAKSLVKTGQVVKYREKVLYGPMLRYDLTAISREPIYFDTYDVLVDCTEQTIQRRLFKPEPVAPGSPMAVLLQKICQTNPTN